MKTLQQEPGPAGGQSIAHESAAAQMMGSVESPTTTDGKKTVELALGDADKAKFCGAGALSMNDRENYAVMMRVAMLSSIEAADVTPNLGFRCARDAR